MTRLVLSATVSSFFLCPGEQSDLAVKCFARHSLWSIFGIFLSGDRVVDLSRPFAEGEMQFADIASWRENFHPVIRMYSTTCPTVSPATRPKLLSTVNSIAFSSRATTVFAYHILVATEKLHFPWC